MAGVLTSILEDAHENDAIRIEVPYAAVPPQRVLFN